MPLESRVETVTVFRRDDRIHVKVEFRFDEEFRAEVADFGNALERREVTARQPIEARVGRLNVMVIPENDATPRNDFAILAGGTGSENIAEWIFEPTPSLDIYRVLVKEDSVTIYDERIRP